MADVIWVGDAPEVAQVDTITIPSDVETGQVFTATIGVKVLTYTFPAGPTQLSVAAAIVAAWNLSDIPEFAEVSASDNLDGTITLTADTPGVPFIVTTLIGTATNEKQVITLGGSPTGGTFTLTYSGQTTGNIAYNASASAVDTALEALSNIGTGDVAVTGSNGGPYTVEFTGALAATDVALLTANASGLIGTNEEQIISLGTVTGGTFTLTFDGQTTGNIAYNADAATVEAALEALSNIGAGEATTTGSAGGPWTVTFSGALAGTDVATITVNGANLTGKLSVSINETTDGIATAENEVHLFWAINNAAVGNVANFDIVGDSNVTSGTFVIVLKRGATTIGTTASIAYDASLTEIQAAIDAVANGLYYSAGEIHIIGEAAGTTLSDGATLSFQCSQSLNDGTYTATITNSLTGGSYAGSGSAVVVQGSTGDTSGSVFFTYGGQSTDDINFAYADEATVQAALEGLSTIGSGNVSVSAIGIGLTAGGLIVEFIGDLSNQNTGLTPIIGTNSGLNYTIHDEIAWTGLAGTNEVQEVSIAGAPGAGTFVLEYGGEQTALLDYNATAAEVEAALEALTTIGTNNVSCTGGDLPGTPVDVEFIGDLSATSLATMTAPGGSAAESVSAGALPTVGITTIQTPVLQATSTPNEGPNDWNVPSNWNTGAVPVNSDNVFIIDGGNILYGLDQSAVTLGRLEISNRETEIGLPRRNASYYEYRDTFLKIGATTIAVGLGAGNSSDRIQIDIGTTSPAITVHDSGAGDDEPAVQFKGVNSTNTASLTIEQGEVGIAIYPDQEAHFATVTQYSGELTIGTEVTLLGLTRTGGQIHADAITIDGIVTL